jgi:hypothetical protein
MTMFFFGGGMTWQLAELKLNAFSSFPLIAYRVETSLEVDPISGRYTNPLSSLGVKVV